MKNEDQSKEVLIEKITALEEEIKRLKDRDSKRIHTEKALIKSKAAAYAFMNATSDLAVLLNTRGIILEVNESAVRRVGKSVGELPGNASLTSSPGNSKISGKYISISSNKPKNPCVTRMNTKA